MKYVFGVDVGGTTVKLGLFTETGTLLEKWEIPTRAEEEGSAILPDIAKALSDCLTRNLLDRADVLGVGIGVPGPVNDEGLVNRCVNLNWGVFNLHEVLGELTGFDGDAIELDGAAKIALADIAQVRLHIDF